MDKKTLSLEEHIKNLEDLIREASENIPNDEDIGALIKKDVRDRLYSKNPECFVSLKRMGREPFFLPICNRRAIVDPKAINISIGVVQKLMANQSSGDANELSSLLDKLTSMKKSQDLDAPSPEKAKERKAVVTKLFNKMGRYIKVVKQKDDEFKD